MKCSVNVLNSPMTRAGTHDSTSDSAIDKSLSDRFSHASKSFAHVARFEIFPNQGPGRDATRLVISVVPNPLTGILLSSWASSAPTVVQKLSTDFFFSHTSGRTLRNSSIWLLIHRYIKSVTLRRRSASNS